MALFTCNVTEINYGFVEIEADTAEEAQELVQDEYNNGNVNWTGSTISDISVKE